MKNEERIEPAEKIVFESVVHDGFAFDVTDFQDFVRLKTEELSKSDAAEEGVTADNGFRLDDLQCAGELLRGVDYRNTKLGRDAPVPNRRLWRRFLPLACHTQFVEASVKEARNVAVTGRHEELRSAYAIIRGDTVLSIGTISKMQVNDRIAKTIESVHRHVAEQATLAEWEPYQATQKQ
jgi:hypothetical protein